MDNNINILDQDFLLISHLDNPSLVETLQNNQHPFVFTSINAVNATACLIKNYGITLKTNSCYCISGKTSACAKQSGFNSLSDAKDATSLADAIISGNENAVLHCTGNLTKQDLYNLLQEAGLEIAICQVYQNNILPVKVPSFDGVMFFSPSQIDAFLTVNELHSQIPAFCIGNTTAEHLAKFSHQNIVISSQSNEQAMLHKVYEYYKIH